MFSRVLGKRVKFQKMPWPIVRFSSGKGTLQMFRWFNEGGFKADIPALKRRFPEVRLLSLEEWLREEGWRYARGSLSHREIDHLVLAGIRAVSTRRANVFLPATATK